MFLYFYIVEVVLWIYCENNYDGCILYKYYFKELLSGIFVLGFFNLLM